MQAFYPLHGQRPRPENGSTIDDEQAILYHLAPLAAARSPEVALASMRKQHWESPQMAVRDGEVDRRSAKRVAVEMFARESDNDRLFVHPATNLSASGIFLESHSYSQRTALERRFINLEFELPEATRTIRVRGEVVGTRRVRGYSHGLAVKFIDLNDDDYKRIDSYVETRRAEGDSEGPMTEAAPTGI
jgi:hypothetical protein